MTRHNVNKSPAIRAVMSLAMATFMFLSSGFGASVAHAEEKIVSYKYKTSEPGSISEFKKLAEEGKDLSGKTVIISTNDVHGAIQKYPYVASLKNFFKNDLHSDVILVDSGDFSQDKKEKKALFHLRTSKVSAVSNICAMQTISMKVRRQI